MEIRKRELDWKTELLRHWREAAGMLACLLNRRRVVGNPEVEIRAGLGTQVATAPIRSISHSH